jgi:Domain of unknown function (DUF4389)
MDEGRLRVHDEEPLRRRRLAVLFRILVFVPQYIVLSLWTVLALIVFPLVWLVALLAGRVPRRLHRFLAAFLRYSGQVAAWAYLLTGRYPDPLRTLEHPFAIMIPDRRPQHRLVTLLRLVLALPALALTTAFRVVLSAAAIPAWFIALALGRTTAGLQELGTFCLRYELETTAYILLLTPRYPRLAPG